AQPDFTRKPMAASVASALRTIVCPHHAGLLSPNHLQRLVRRLNVAAPHFQPCTRPACSIHSSISGPCASSSVLTLTYRLLSVVPSGGGGSNSAPPRKTTFTDTS